MIEENQIEKIKEIIQEFFEKMNIATSVLEISPSLTEENIDAINVEIKTDEPQILIGQQGQTLFEIQRLLRAILSKNLKKIFYLSLDINSYKKNKIEHLKYLAKEIADQVAQTKEEKTLSPMSSYERRIVHSELSKRADVLTESRGDGFERHIIIRPC